MAKKRWTKAMRIEHGKKIAASKAANGGAAKRSTATQREPFLQWLARIERAGTAARVLREELSW